MIKFKHIARLTSLCALSGSLFIPALAGAEQTEIGSGSLTGESSGIQKGSGDLSPSVGSSDINEYKHQDEQINLDANAGNVRVLRTDQKALINDYITKTYPVKNVNSRELRNVLRTVIGLEGGRAEVIKDKTTKEEFIQVICPKFQIPYWDVAIPALDESYVREYDTGSGDVYYKAKNRDAAAVDFIASFYASDSGVSSVDTTNNAVNRIDEPYRIENYLKAAGIVDIPANQVLLDVTLYEVNSNNDLKLGVDYVNWKNGPGRNLANFVFEAVNARTRASNFTSIFDPFTPGGYAAGNGRDNNIQHDFDQSYRAVNYLLTSNYIDFLQVKGKARVVTKKSLMVKSSNTASFSTDDAIVAIVSSPSDLDEVDGDSGSAASEVSSIYAERNDKNGSVYYSYIDDFQREVHVRPAGSTGIYFSATPFVGTESMELVIRLDNADLNGLAPNGQPIISSRCLSTTVRLRDGEPYVITGLKRTRDIKESGKAPGLGDIPVLGYLFGGETDVKRQNDVVIVVQPKFYLASQPAIQNPARVNNIKQVVVGGGNVSLPSNPIGYDQWLLDK